MPRLPGSPEESLGGLPSARTGRQIAVADTSAAAQGFANLGRQLFESAATVREGWEQLEGTRFESRWAAFQTERALDFDREAEGLAPETAAGFTGRYVGKDSGFAKATDAFVESAPSFLREEARARVARMRGLYTGEALKVERQHQKTFALNTLDDSMQGAHLPAVQAAAALPSNSPRKLPWLREQIAAYHAQVDATPGLNAAERAALKRDGAASLEGAFAIGLPASERVLLDPLTVNTTLVERIAEVESGGDATAANPNSSALGTHQFVKGTWLELVRKHRPDIAKGKTDGQLLALREDPALSAEMAEAYLVHNSEMLQSYGLPATAGNLYLAHFLGPNGARAMLEADPSALAAEVNPDAAKANPGVFTEGLTAGDLAQWAAAKMGGNVVVADWARSLDAIPYETKLAVARDGAEALVKARTAMEEADQEAYDGWMLDFRTGIEQGGIGLAQWQQALDAGRFRGADATTMRNLIESRTKDQINLANASSWLSGVIRGEVEPDMFDGDNRQRVDLLFDKGGPGGAALLSPDPEQAGQAAALLSRVAQTTRILPSSAVSSLRTGIRSANPETMLRSFELLDGLYNDERTRASVEQFFASDLDRLIDYRTAAKLLPPDALAERLAGASREDMDIRRERMTAARREVEDLTAADVAARFGPPLIFGTPLYGERVLPPVMPDDQIRMAKEFKDAFSRIAAWGLNPDDAEPEAMRLLSQRWGATTVGTEVRMMRYPPETQYPAVDGGHEYMREQLDDFMRERVPELFTTPRASIYYRPPEYFLLTLPETEASIAANRKVLPAVEPGRATAMTGRPYPPRQTYTPPRYGVAYRDQDGVLHVLTEANSARPVRISFDYQGARAVSRGAFAAERTRRDENPMPTEEELIRQSMTPAPSQITDAIANPDDPGGFAFP